MEKHNIPKIRQVNVWRNTKTPKNGDSTPHPKTLLPMRTFIRLMTSILEGLISNNLVGAFSLHCWIAPAEFTLDKLCQKHDTAPESQQLDKLSYLLAPDFCSAVDPNRLQLLSVDSAFTISPDLLTNHRSRSFPRLLLFWHSIEFRVQNCRLSGIQWGKWCRRKRISLRPAWPIVLPDVSSSAQ